MKNTLQEFLLSKGFSLRPVFNGEFVRFDRNGKTLSGWFVGREYKVGEKSIAVARFGDWATAEQYEWITEGEYTPEERAEIDAAIMQATTAERNARATLHEEVAAKSAAKWGNFSDRGRSPYFEKKGLGSNLLGVGLLGCKLFSVPDDVLTVVPVRDVHGKLWGLQYISSDGKRKNFASGMKIRGCFHLLGELPENYTGDVYVCEGIATAGSVFLATGRPTAAAFNAGNLKPVAEALAGLCAARGQSVRVVVGGDEDRWTTRSDGATPWNPGREAAEAAAFSVGGVAIFPQFSSLDDRPTDFNDLHALDGLEAVKKQLTAEMAEKPVAARAGGALSAPRSAKGGRPQKIPEKMVVDALLDEYDGRLIHQGKDVFRYTGTHWHHLTPDETDELRRAIGNLYGGLEGSGTIESTYKTLLIYMPVAPVDLFQPRPDRVNFKNGTLHLTRGSDYKWTTEFKEHDRNDFLTNVIPLTYEPEKAEKNPDFEEMLVRVFEGDPDAEQKVRAIRQMYGACLAPIYPHLFLLHGPAGSGKSSLIMPAMRLLDQANWCSVQPHEFKGFLMESMIGKLVNLRTDINTHQPIDDDTIKMIEDRVPVRIDRKFQTPVYAPLPAVHIFGGNDIPPTRDGASGAHSRRWTFIALKKYKSGDSGFRKDHGNWVFDQSPQGVLNFALQGLTDLLESEGHYLHPESGRTEMAAWQREHDPVSQFLQDAVEGDLDSQTKIVVHPEARIERKLAWEGYKAWANSTGRGQNRMTKTLFYRRLAALGFALKKIDGLYYFSGLGVRPEPGAKF
jgi:phage/plasmid-associated DNA primase/phage/plasmid primase-like uncharacterized protein